MSSRPYSLVCAVDLSENASPVIEHALSEAHRHREVSVHFLTVCEPKKGRFLKTDPVLSDLEEADQKLRALVTDTLPAFADAEGSKRSVRFHARAGNADEQILELAQEARAHRIVVGHHTSERHRKLPGGIATAVVNGAPCTVEIVQVPNYEADEHNYQQCAECVLVRERSGGNQWFCKEHSDGRVPRLSGSVGISSPAPGWGLF